MPEIPDECWTRVKGRLRAEVGEAVYSSWFARMELESVEADTARISVPTRFLKSWIQSHYVERLLNCWQSERPAVTRIDLSVRSAVIRNMPPPCAMAPVAVAPLEKRENNHFRHEMKAIIPSGLPVQDSHGGSPLDPRLTFESFVVGRSNTLAHAASKQVATARRSDPVMFNPLYIHAGVGLGKTHLLQAVALKINLSGERHALYLTAERFMYGFASALRSQTALAFKDALRGIDVLVIDDLQFLQGKNSQAEFSHTLNSLLDGGRQVVVAADRPPTELESLDERMRSRLAGGLAVEVGALDEELRLEILSARVRADRISSRNSSSSAPTSTASPPASRERMRSSRLSSSVGGRSAATTTWRPPSSSELRVWENSAWLFLPWRNCRSSMTSTSIPRSASLKASAVWLRSAEAKPYMKRSAVRYRAWRSPER